VTDPQRELRRRIFTAFAETGEPPDVSGEDESDLMALENQHVIVRDGLGAIRMAHPFAAHHTGARVEAGGRTWWGNCAWDAFGIAAALGLKNYKVTGNGLRAEAGVLFHVAVPAYEWWADIGFT
jgi:hypothetical protein